MPPIQPLEPQKNDEPVATLEEIEAKQVKFNPTDIVRVHNPDTVDFDFQFGVKGRFDAKGKTLGSEPIRYSLPAGKTVPMHGYMADYVCKHLTDRLLMKAGQTRRLNDEYTRKALALTIILGKQEIITPEAQLTEAERIQQSFNQLQKTDDSPVVADDTEVPLDEADAILSGIDEETTAEVTGNNTPSEFPDADPSSAAA